MQPDEELARIGLRIAAGLQLAPLNAESQQAAKVARIGYLSGLTPASDAENREAFRQGLRELGYVEGKNIVIEYRYAEGKLDRLPTLAAELLIFIKYSDISQDL